MPEKQPTLRQLKSRAQLVKPLIKLGKAGASPEFLAEFNGLLTRHELVKIRFEGHKDERKTLSKEIAQVSKSLLVQQVGLTAVYDLGAVQTE
jgi:RNA-binding protein YhbY